MSIAPPRPKMPPLNALRAFEAAARLSSFVAAGEELSVTPGAIASHVKTLEAALGAKLFKRLAHGIELTELGASVASQFTDAFDRLGEAVHHLRGEAAPLEIRIAALPSIAQLWLSPRLPAIRAAMPQMSISVTALEHPPNLKREPFDFAIFFTTDPPQETHRVLALEKICPVCAPEIAQRLQRPADLARETLLHDSTWSEDWSIWLSSISPGLNIPVAGPSYSLYALAVEEAKNGAGLLMGHMSLLSEAIDRGELVQPFNGVVPLDITMTLRPARRLVPGSPLCEVADRLAV